MLSVCYFNDCRYGIEGLGLMFMKTFLATGRMLYYQACFPLVMAAKISVLSEAAALR
jgi:hypothetical protein